MVRVTGESSDISVQALLVGASNVTAFAGVNGPATNAGAIGLSLTGVNFALALLTPTAPTTGAATDLRKFTALKSTVASVSFVGIDGLVVSGTGLSVAVNQGSGTLNNSPSHDVVDFAGARKLTVNTGGGNHLDIDFSGSLGNLIQAEGTVTVDVFGFFHVSGNFAFEKSTETVHVAGDAPGTNISVQALRVGVSGVNAFAGLNGGTAAAVGLSLTNVDFALALLSVSPPATGTATDFRTFTALGATVGSASFVGLDGLTVAVVNSPVAINQADGATDPAPVSP